MNCKPNQCSTCHSATCGEKKPNGSQQQSGIERLATHQMNTINHVVAVMSGKGGVGKSSVTALLASELSRHGFKTGILDADMTGPSIPKMFGIKERPKADRNGIYPPASNSGIKVMSVNLLLAKEDDPVVWRGPVIAGAVRQFWSEVIWGKLDFLLVDLPPGTGDSPLTVMQSLPVNGVVIVSSPQDLAHMVVRKAIKMVKKLAIPIYGIVENMSYLQCPHCQEAIEIFGSRTKAQDNPEIPILGEAPLDPSLSRMCDEGVVEFYTSQWITKIAEGILAKTIKGKN